MTICFVSLILAMMIIIVYFLKIKTVPETLNEDSMLAKQKRSVQKTMFNNVNKKTLQKRLQTNSTFIASKEPTVFETYNKSINNILNKRMRGGRVHRINQSKNMKALLNKRERGSIMNIPYTKKRSAETRLIEVQNLTYCSFTLVEKNFKETKLQLDELKLQPVYLFYVQLELENQRFSMRQREELLHWQFVLRSEKSLMSLPVDFDIITFNLFSTNSETLLALNVSYNYSNCTENISYASQSLRVLLWSKLFANDTRYYLCHRELHEDFGRTLLYAITNIWIGYNFNCSTASTGENEVQNSIYYFTIVIEIFCYVLSLQFVWIFVLLDISFKNKKRVDNEYEPIYTRNERPYGPKQFLFKLLHFKTQCSKNCLLGICYKCNPSVRIILLFFIFHFLFTFFRIGLRYGWGGFISEDYINVFRPCEWFIYLLYLYTNCSESWACVFDCFYTAYFPLGFIFLGNQLQNIYLSHINSYIGSNDNDENILRMKTSLSDKFVFPWYVFCVHRNNFFKKIQLILSCCFPIFPFICNALDVCACKCRNRNVMGIIICKCMCKLLAFILVYVLCLRPIISTFTFLFRAFTYLVLVAIPINTDIMRYFVIIFTALLYYYKFILQVSNMYAEILEYIFQIKENQEIEQTRQISEYSVLETNERSEHRFVSEEMFDAICKKLFFTKKKLYFVFFKMGIITMYLCLVLQILDDDQLALSGYDIGDFVKIALAAIGPYAVSLFLKGNRKTCLTNKDKFEIRQVFNQYITRNSTTINESSSHSNDSDHQSDALSERLNLIRTETRTYT